MQREFITTPQALDRYLHDLAWRRYRVRLPAGVLSAGDSRVSVTQAQVRAAVAALQAHLSCLDHGDRRTDV